MHRSPVAHRRPRPLQFFSSFSTSPPATTPVCPSSCPSFPRSTLAFILPHRQSRGWAFPLTPSPARALFPPQPLCRSSVCLELGRVSFPLPLLLASSRHPRSTPNAACVHPHHPPPHALHTHLPTFTRSRSALLHHHLRLSPLAPRRLPPRPLVALHRHSLLLNLLIATPTPASLLSHYSPRAASPLVGGDVVVAPSLSSAPLHPLSSARSRCSTTRRCSQDAYKPWTISTLPAYRLGSTLFMGRGQKGFGARSSVAVCKEPP